MLFRGMRRCPIAGGWWSHGSVSAGVQALYCALGSCSSEEDDCCVVGLIRFFSGDMIVMDSVEVRDRKEFDATDWELCPRPEPDAPAQSGASLGWVYATS